MPLCLIQALPGIRYSLTDTLSVGVPDLCTESSEDVPLACRKEVREGRVALYADSLPQHDGHSFSYEALSEMCKRWRDRGLFSFVEVRCSGQIGREEKECLYRLKQAADWLILDATHQIDVPTKMLQTEQWGHQAKVMMEIGKKVGLHVVLDDSLPDEIWFPWVAKVALELGAPGFLFVEGDSMERGAAIIRGVQDILSSHPLAKDSARLIPVLRSPSHMIGGVSCHVLDFSALDALLIESCRSFFGGIVVQQKETGQTFGLSSWQAVVKMFPDKQSSTSLLSSSVVQARVIPEQLRQMLLRGIYDLVLWTTQHNQVRMAQGVKELESHWNQCLKETFQNADAMADMKTIVTTVLEQSKEAVEKSGGSTPARPSIIGSFFNSMNA